jgi:ABC-type lipoprotein export system ATPase subunit
MVILENVSKIYKAHAKTVKALDEVSVHIKKGEFVVIHGPSGSGKTTLLLTIAGMLRPTSGTVIVEQKPLYSLSLSKRAEFRAQNIGFIFQMFHLVPYLNVLDNVRLAAGTNNNDIGKNAASELLIKVGIQELAFYKPAELSAGEKQRAATARALCNTPKILLADEPTGNLDSENAAALLRHFAEFHRCGGTVIMVTHQTIAAQYADRIICMQNGRLIL